LHRPDCGAMLLARSHPAPVREGRATTDDLASAKIGADDMQGVDTRHLDRGPLRAGDQVQVRSEREILDSLDSSGRLEGLPFMPEMVRYCGETLRVFKRADKTCDSIWSPGMRRMEDAVFLWGARCDGSAHGGCQAECLLFWKEAWLQAASPQHGHRAPEMPERPRRHDDAIASRCDPEDLVRATTVPPGSNSETYSCQATEIGRASTELPPMPRWDVRQYTGDVRSGNIRIGRLTAVMSKQLVESVTYRLARSRIGREVVVPATRRFAKRHRWVARGQEASGPAASSRELRGGLDLRPGDRVRVRSRQEIEATLDSKRRNRGLSFNDEMHCYCGSEYRVLKRVERIINEPTGRMVILRDCIVLDGVTCQGDYHRFCPRAVYPYWREAWLTKLD